MRISIKQKKIKPVLLFAILIPCLALTIFALSQVQRLQQYAATKTESNPPFYGCIHMGEANTINCGSRLGSFSWTKDLTLHDRPLDNQTVYYGDRVKGSIKFANVGDLPIQIANIGIIANAADGKHVVQFLPKSGQLNLEPQKDTTIKDASYIFDGPDPAGQWSVSPNITDSDGQSLVSDDKKKTLTVNATCTALRAQELTEKDKTNLKEYCSTNATSKLCTSREYCEIFKGNNCTQPNVSQETPGWQCDTRVYLAKTEQDMLEELCKVYPDSDACEQFCAKTVGSSICPPKYLFIDTRTGKPIPLHNPNAIYVAHPDQLKFQYSGKYPKTAVRLKSPNISLANEKTAVAGASTSIAMGLPGPGGASGAVDIKPPTDSTLTAPDANGTPLKTPADTAAAPPPAAVAAPPPPAPPAAPPAPPAPAPGPPPACGTSGQPACGLEKNTLPPDPSAGRLVDPTNPNTSLTNPKTSQAGDYGYNPSCASGRMDENPTDDPAGVAQASCCANSLTLREGCCSQQCTVWSQQVTPNGQTTLKDGAGTVCANSTAAANASLASNTCGKSYNDTVPDNLKGTGGNGGPQPALGVGNNSNNAQNTVNGPKTGNGIGPGVCTGNSCGPTNIGNGTYVGTDNQKCFDSGLTYDPVAGTCGGSAGGNNKVEVGATIGTDKQKCFDSGLAYNPAAGTCGAVYGGNNSVGVGTYVGADNQKCTAVDLPYLSASAVCGGDIAPNNKGTVDGSRCVAGDGSSCNSGHCNASGLCEPAGPK